MGSIVIPACTQVISLSTHDNAFNPRDRKILSITQFALFRGRITHKTYTYSKETSLKLSPPAYPGSGTIRVSYVAQLFFRFRVSFPLLLFVRSQFRTVGLV